jgi:hypothetical protein
MEDPSAALPEQVYRDPVDERIAGYSGLVRPLAGLADRITRPGRAGTAQRMNREYLENIHKRRLAQAQAQGAQADTAVKQLQAAAVSDDPEISGPAIERLTALQKAMSAGRNTNDLGLYSKLVQGMDSEGNKVEKKTGTETAGSSPAGEPVNVDDIIPQTSTLTQAVERAKEAINVRMRQKAALDKELEDIQKPGATRTTHRLNPYTSQPIGSQQTPVNIGWISRRKQEIPVQKAKLDAEIKALQKTAERYGQSTITGGPGHAPKTF